MPSAIKCHDVSLSVKSEPRAISAQRFITFVTTRKSRMEPLVPSLAPYIPSTYTTKSATYKTGLQGREPPAGASPWGLLEPSRRKLPSRRNPRLFFSTFEPAPKISNYVASRGTCVQIVARAKGTFMARCKCFLSRVLRHGRRPTEEFSRHVRGMRRIIQKGNDDSHDFF